MHKLTKKFFFILLTLSILWHFLCGNKDVKFVRYSDHVQYY